MGKKHTHKQKTSKQLSSAHGVAETRAEILLSYGEEMGTQSKRFWVSRETKRPFILLEGTLPDSVETLTFYLHIRGKRRSG